jgi:hypothetical protein
MSAIARRGVFLSYRRDDAGPYARSLQLQLSQRIPDTPVFMDLDSIEPGLDFAEVIEQAVNTSAVLVALIGRQWATLTDESGDRRLDNPDDYVRFEVKTALEQGLRVIPVLIDGARPPRSQELPADLRKLARLNAHKLSYDRYQDDADRLLDLIQRVLATLNDQEEAGRKTREEDRRRAKSAEATTSKAVFVKVTKTARRRLITVRVDGEIHTVDYRLAFLDIAIPCTIMLDGVTLYRKTMIPTKFNFTLGREEEHQARIEADDKGVNKISKLRLFIDGEVIYSDGPW